MKQEALEVLKNRRAIRSYKPEQITDEELNAVLEAGLYAATGAGKQGIRILVVQKPEDVKECNQRICHPKSQVLDHINYIKDNNILTLRMNEFEMWMDKRINLPKSTLITIDDGWRMYIGIDLFEENEINATVFLITSWFKEIKFLNDYKYIEFHSHGDNLHIAGKCPNGRGGLIKCLEKSKLLEDLALSRKKLGGSTAFCYPFYDYNDYAIAALKEAGFTMAFRGGQKKASQNDNKYKIPRYEIFRSDTMEKIKNYIG